MCRSSEWNFTGNPQTETGLPNIFHSQHSPQPTNLKTSGDFKATCVYLSIYLFPFTLQAVSMSATAFRLRLAVAITSSCRQEFPAATALAVARVMPFVIRIDSSGEDVFSGTSLDWNTWKDRKNKQKQIGKMTRKWDTCAQYIFLCSHPLLPSLHTGLDWRIEPNCIFQCVLKRTKNQEEEKR